MEASISSGTSLFRLPRGKVDRIIFTDSESGAELMALGAKPSGIIYLDPTAPLMITLKTAAVLGMFFLLPYLLVEIWLFVSPGLYPHERRFAVPFLLSGVALFAIGAGFAYSTFAFALQFFLPVCAGGSLPLQRHGRLPKLRALHDGGIRHRL
jgi:Sec-independent protein secretion pathway component TatC